MRVEPMETERSRRSEMDERSTEAVLDRALTKVRAGREPYVRPAVLAALLELRSSDKLSPEFHRAAEMLAARTGEERERTSEAGSRARKVSVSMPEELSEAVHERVGRGGFSRYVTEAVAKQLELDLLAELSATLEEEHGAVSDEALAEAESVWPDAD